MKRRSFIRRMIFAGLATVFLELPLPKREEPVTATVLIENLDVSHADFRDFGDRMFDQMWEDWRAAEMRYWRGT